MSVEVAQHDLVSRLLFPCHHNAFGHSVGKLRHGDDVMFGHVIFLGLLMKRGHKMEMRGAIFAPLDFKPYQTFSKPP